MKHWLRNILRAAGKPLRVAGRLISNAWRALVSVLRKPKWRHGGFGLALMAGLLLVAVLLNIGVQNLETNYGWRKDFSFNGYATTGEETKMVVDTLQTPIELYLLYQNGDMDSQLYEVLDRYRLLSDQISVLPVDVAKNPGIVTRFQSDVTTELDVDSVVVYSPDTQRFKVLGYTDFVTQSYNLEEGVFEYSGLAYEKKLTEAIANVAQKQLPMIGILQEHGELSLEALANLTSFLQSNNYDFKTVTMTSGDTLEGIDLLLIADLQKDLDSVELQSIKTFAEGGGALFVIRDYTDPVGLPNYTSLLKSYGVEPIKGLVVAGEEDTGSYYRERIYLIPYLNQIEMTLPLISGGMDELLMPGAGAFETPQQTDSALSATTVLKSGPNAYVRDVAGDNISIDYQEGDRKGEFTLAILAARMHANGNVSQMFAIGNSATFTQEYMYQSTYNEAFIMQTMGALLPQKTVDLNIVAKSAFHPGLTASSQLPGVALLTALPLLVLLCAVLILLPRKNR